MTEQSPSGNRWEPLTGSEASETEVPATYVPLDHVDEPAPEPRSPFLSRSRLAVAGVVGALLLGGGIGGYALGQVHHDSSDSAIPGGFQGDDHGPGRFDHEDAGFDGDHGAPGQTTPGGTAPGQGAES